MKNRISYCFLLFFLMQGNICFSQLPPIIEWQNAIGPTSNSTTQPTPIVKCSDGGFLIGASSQYNSADDKSEDCIGNSGEEDYWIIRIDSVGNILWENTIGGYNPDFLTDAFQTTDGGFMIAGYSASYIFGDKTESCRGVEDYWVVKVNSNGIVEWDKTYGGSYIDMLLSICKTKDGGFILGGQSASPISGEKTEGLMGPPNYPDYWIIKADSLGNIQWQNTIGGNYSDFLTKVFQTRDGGYILGGYSGSDLSGDKTEGTVGGTGLKDIWIVKTDSMGNIIWQNTIGGNEDEYLFAMDTTSDGGYILGAFSNSPISGDKTEGNNDYDFWVVKIDSLGAIQWQNTICGNIGDRLYSIQQTIDGGYILGGESSSGIFCDKTEQPLGVGMDNWIIKLSGTGLIEWENTIGGDWQDVCRIIREVGPGEYIVGGPSASVLHADKKDNASGFDNWIYKLSDKYNSMSGKLFADLNSNSLQDSGECGIAYSKVTETTSGNVAFTDISGNYSVGFFGTGNFTAVPSSLNNFNVTPASLTSTFSGVQQTVTNQDFAFEPSVAVGDLRVQLSPGGNFRSNMVQTYMISYQNRGNISVAPTIVLTLDGNLSYLNASENPTLITQDSINWTLPAMAPMQQGNIVLTVHVQNGLPVNTLITSMVKIDDPAIADINTTDNIDVSIIPTTGSYDPNDIIVNEDTLLVSQLTSPPFLEYTIHFQNTGNDTAFNVSVMNKIVDMLDMSSFEVIASSHPVQVSYTALHARNITFTFDNILLPDSNVNQIGSNGFIRYRIKPLSTLVDGNNVLNSIGIVFDFNMPVWTDTASTRIVQPVFTDDVFKDDNSISIFPNPVNDECMLMISHGIEYHINVFDVLGQLIMTNESRANISSVHPMIDVHRLVPGMYFFEVTTEKRKYNIPVIKY
jgi:hypothetical protein